MNFKSSSAQIPLERGTRQPLSLFAQEYSLIYSICFLIKAGRSLEEKHAAFKRNDVSLHSKKAQLNYKSIYSLI